MTPPWMPEAVGICVRWIGSAVKGSTIAVRSVTVATLSTAEILLKLIESHVADDLAKFKDSLIRRQKADADAAAAEAQRKMAEAAEASNRANLHKRRDRVAKLEIDAKKLQNAKTAAEIIAIKTESEIRRIQAEAEARARLLEAISKVKQEGGAAILDSENLRQILDANLHGLPQPPSSESETPMHEG